jgi:hypothetical protein
MTMDDLNVYSNHVPGTSAQKPPRTGWPRKRASGLIPIIVFEFSKT